MTQKHKAPRSPFIRALEPRLLFDGAAVGTVADTATDQSFASHADKSSATASHNARPVAGADTGRSSADRALAASDNTRADAHRAAVFVDTRAADQAAALAALEDKGSTEVYVVDASDDGAAAVAEVLENRAGEYDSLVVVGHGENGERTLGTSSFDALTASDAFDGVSGQWRSLQSGVELADTRTIELSLDADMVAEGWKQGSAADTAATARFVDAQHGADTTDVAAINQASANRPGANIVFVDTAINNYQGLVEELDSSSEIVLLDSDRDGVVQIAGYLDGRTDVAGVHILSHGAEGEIALGNATLDAASIDGEYADELAAIGRSLSGDGDILIYGCDFTGGEKGAAAARLLAERTGADVAASSDDTGSSNYDGDWNLETHIGEIEATALDASAWDGRLADPIAPNFSGTPTLVSGTANSAGAVYRFSNVSPGIDALVTIDQISNSTIVTLDDNANGVPEAFSPTLRGTNADAFVQFSFRFVDSGTNNARLANFTANALDVDSTTESVQFQAASSYTTEGNTFTSLQVDAQNNVAVRGGGTGAFPTSRSDTRYIVSATYQDTSAFTYRAGVNGADRQTALLFEGFQTGTPNNDTIRYANPVTVQLPTAREDTVTTSENTPIQFNPTVNDGLGTPGTTITQINGQAITAGGAAVSVANGSVRLAIDGSLIYTPIAGFGGTDNFTYTIRDANGRVSTATVNAVIDNDRDGVNNARDIDDDNDGILDVNEGYQPLAQTGAWTLVNSTTATMNLGNGIIVRASANGTDALSNGSFGTAGSFWSSDLAGDVSLATVFNGANSITFSFENASGNSVQVRNPVVHFDRIGGRLGGNNGNQTSQLFALQNGLSWSRLAGTNDFGATSTTVQDSGVGTPSANNWVAASSLNDADGTAAGSLRVNALTSSFTVRSSGNDADGVSFIIEARPQSLDSDGDGLADHLDIDKDNDSITDNVEAQTTAGYRAPSGVGGTAAFRDANGDGLDDNYGPNGLTQVDTDGDGTLDTLDRDSDNDGRSDLLESGRANTTLTGQDSDGDGLDNAFDTVAGFDVNDNNVAGDTGGASGAYGRFTLADTDLDTNANETTANRTTNNAVPLSADLDYRDNQTPTAAADTVTTNEDTTLTRTAANGLLANDVRANNQALAITSFTVNGQTTTVDATNGGTASIAGVGALTIRADGSYVFAPVANFNGPVPQVSYTATANNGSASSVLNITVTPVDDAPQNNLPARQTVPEDSVIVFAQANGNAISVQDIDSGTVTVQLSASNGLVTLGRTTGLTFGAGDGTADATMTFTGSVASVNAALEGARLAATPGDYIGNASLIVRSNSGDAQGPSSTDTLQISYTPVADIVNDIATTSEDTAVTINVLGNDSFENPNAAISAINGNPIAVGGNAVSVANGSVRLLADGQLRFTPAADYNGDTSFNYTVTTANNTETATVTVRIDPANDAPTVVDPLPDRSGQDGDPVTIATSGAFADIDGDTLTYTVAGLPIGLAIDAQTGEITGNLPANASALGPYTVTVTASDGNGASVSDTFTISSANVAPTAALDTAATAENAATVGNVLANDVDGGNDRDPLTVSQVAGIAGNIGQPTVGSNGGTFTIGGDGSYSFDPGADFNDLSVGEARTTQIAYQVSDGQGGVDTSTLTVTVNGANDAPTVIAPLDNQSSQDGDTVSVATAGAFDDVDGNDTLAYTATNLPPGLTIDADTGVISGMLSADASQADPYRVTVTATDSSGAPVSSTFTWAVANPAPIANTDTGATGENLVTTGNVLVNDVDGGDDADTLVVSQVGGAADSVGQPVAGDNGGRFTVGVDGAYSFDPGADFDYLSAGETATTLVTYSISDGQGGTSTSVLSVIVTGANDTPVADTIPPQNDRDAESVNFPTSGFFADPDANDTPTYDAAGLPPGLTIDPDTGVISGQLASGASQGGDNGRYSVTVSIDDGQGGTASTTFDWTIANQAVSGVDDTDTTTEDAAIDRAADQGVLGNDVDPDLDTLTVTQVDNSADNLGTPVVGSNGGSFTINDDGAYSFDPGSAFQYLSDGERATTSVIYQVSDGQGGTDTARLTVTITGVNDAPIVDIPLEDLANSDGESVSVPTAGAFLDVDANDSLSFSATGLPPGLSLNTATGEITGRLTADASQGGVAGVYTVTVTADDGNAGGQTSTQFDWTVSNRPPIANDDSAATTENAPAISGGVLVNDLDGGADTDPLIVTQVNAATANVAQPIRGSNGGTFTVNADGSYTFDGGGDFDRLAEGQRATTTVTYQASDGQGGSDTATLTVTVTGTNDAPVVQTPLADLAANDGDRVTVPTAATFRDPDTNDRLTYSAAGLPAGLTINAQTGVISGTIDRSASQVNSGNYAVTVTASDGRGGNVTDTFAWNITNRRPTAVDDTAMTTENAATAGSVIGNDRDGAGDTDPLSVTQVGGSAAGVGAPVVGGNGGTFTVNADGSYIFDPGVDFDDLAADQSRTTSIVYQISDGQGGFDSARLTVTVTGANDAPIVVADGLGDLNSNNSEDVSVPTAGAFADADTDDVLTYSVAGLPAGLLFDTQTGVISGTLAPNASGGGPNGDGVYVVTVTASDGVAQVQSSFNWTIDNLPVVAQDDTGSTIENVRLDVDAANGVTANDIDADGGGIQVTGVGGAPDGVGMTVDGGNGGQFIVNQDGSYSFIPGLDFDALAVGEQVTTSVTYQISDGLGASDTGRLTITVTGTNDAPTIAREPSPVSSNDGDTVTVPTAGNFADVDDSDTLAYSASNLPPGLTIDAATGVIGGRLNADASTGGVNNDGVYAVVVTADDGNGGSVDTTFTWTVVNRPPTANNDANAVTVGATASGSVSANDVDGGNDTDTLTVASVNGALANVAAEVAGDNGGIFVINADGSYTFDPGADFDGLGADESATSTVVYEISDGQGGVDEARLTLTVSGINDAPTTNGLIDQANNDGETISITTADAFSDADANDTLTYSAGDTLPPGLTIDPDTGRITGMLTPDASQAGPGGDGVYPVTVTATDSANAAVSATFTWSVANSAPVAVNDSTAVSENQATRGNVITGDSGVGADRDGGVDNDTLTVVDVDGNAVAVGQPASVAGDLGGIFTVNADGSYDFAPGTDFDSLAAGESAITGVTYRISDGQGGFDSARLTVTVTGANDAPTVDNALSDVASNDGDTANIATAGAFADVDANDTLTYEASGLPDGVTIDADTGEISGTLNSAASQINGGVYTVTVTGIDSQGARVSDQFTWTIANPIPIAVTDTAATTQNTSILRDAANGVLANDSDGNNDNDPLTIAQVAGSADSVGEAVQGTGGGLFTVASDGSYTFDPGTDFDDLGVGESRNTTVSYQVSDGQGGSATSRVVVTVNGANDGPTVGTPLTDLSSRDGDTVSTSVATAFQDADTADRLTYSAGDTLPPGLVLDADTGRITGTITSDASVAGPYTVTITATDTSGQSVQDEFVWMIANPAPESMPDTAATDENTDVSVTADSGVLANDADGGNDNDTLVVAQVDGSADNVNTAVAGSNGGLFTIAADGSYDFAPGTDFDDLAVNESRTTQISYQVSDGQGGVATDTLTLTVNGTNDAPTVVDATPDQVGSDGDAISISTAGAFSDRDASDTLTYSAANLPDGFVIDPDTGLITGTLGPDASQNGPFTITVTAADGNGASVTDTFDLTSSNVAPLAMGDSVETSENSAVSGNALINDNDGGNDSDDLSVSQVGGLAANLDTAVAGNNGGTFTVSANGAYVFDPGADFDDLAVGQSRTTSVSYQVSDGQGGVDNSTITVTVNARNDAPVVVQGTPDQNANDGDTLSIAAGNAFADADNGDTLSYSANGLPVGLTIDADTGLITGTLGPNASQNGPFTVQVTASDGNGGTSTDAFVIASNNVAPVAANDAANTGERVAISGDVLANDRDGGNDGDVINVAQVNGVAANVGQATAGSGGGVFTVNANGSYSFDPGTDFLDLRSGDSRDTSISYQVSDGQGGTATATLAVTVNGGNDAPIVTAPTPDQTARDGDPISIAAGDAFTDIEGDTLSYTAAGLPDGLTIDANTGLITGMLGANASQNGPFSVQVTADDGSGGTATETFVITSANVAPVTSADQASTTENTPATGNVLANDTDGGNDSDTLSVSQVNGDPDSVGQPVEGANGGSFTIGDDGGYVFQPGADFDDLAVGESRTTSITYQASDGQGGFDTQTLVVTVNGVNDAPIVAQGTPDQSARDGDAVSIAAGDAFSDADASDQLSYSATGLPAGLSIDSGTGQITGTLDPDASADGPFTIVVTADDGNGASVADSFTLTASNVAPIAGADTNTAEENTAAVGNVLANDADGGNDTDTLVVSQVAGAAGNIGQPTDGSAGGRFTVNADGSYLFEPGADFDDLGSGETRITRIGYQVSDGQGGVDTQFVTVTVMGTNDAPVVMQGTQDQSANDGDSVSIAAGAAFADVEGDDLSFAANGLPPGLTIDPATGRVTGTLAPSASANGPYTVTVTARDGNGATVSDQFTLTPANVAPVASADTVTTDENTPATGNVLANDRDGGNDGDTLVVNQVGGNANGVGQPVAGNNGGTFTISADGRYVFQPGTDFDDLNAGQTRTSQVSYQVSDGQGGFDTQTLVVTVNGANDAPVVDRPTPDQRAADGDTLAIAAGEAFADSDNGELRYTATGLPVGLTIDPDTGLISGTLGADASANGPYTITVTANDGSGGTVANSFALNAANVAPVARPDSAAVGENTPTTGNVLVNDADGGNDTDRLAVTQVNGSAANVGQPTLGSNGGTFTIDIDGSYRFEPGADFDDLGTGETRTSTTTYQVSDGQGGFDTQTVTITVTGANDGPTVARPTPDQNAADGDTLAIAAGDAFVDAEGDDLSFTATGLPAGLLIDANSGLITGTLAADASVRGPYTITVTASDGNGGTLSNTFALGSANQAPVAAPDQVTVAQNGSGTGNVLLNDRDGGNDSDVLSVSGVGGNAASVGQPVIGSNGGIFAINADGGYSFNAGRDFNDLGAGESRTSTITYQVSDGQGGVATQRVTATVNGANDAPTVARPTPDQSARDGDRIAIAAGEAFADAEGDNLSYSAAGLPAGLTIDPDTGLISGTLGADASVNGPYTIAVTANDGNGASVVDTFTLTPTNQAPLATADTIRTGENRVATGNVLANDRDGGNDSDTLSVSRVGGSAGNVGQPTLGSNGGVFTVDANGRYTFAPGTDFDDLGAGETRTSTTTYQVSDGQGGFDTQTVTVVVTGANDAPTVRQGTPDRAANDGDRVSIAAGEAFADAEGDALSYSATGLPNGLMIDPKTGLVTGTLASDASANGPYTIIVTANDGNGGTITDRFTLSPANVAPRAAPDLATTGENTRASGNVLVNDRDGRSDGDTLEVAQVGGSGSNLGQPTAGSNGGVFIINADGSYTFEPGEDFDSLNAGEARTSAIDYQVSDGQGGVDTQTVTVTITGTNDAPIVVRPIAAQRANDGADVSIAAGDVFRDADGNRLSYTATGLPEGLVIDPDTGLITGTLASNASVAGPYTITVTADDGNGGIASTRLTLNARNTSPVGGDDTGATRAQTPINRDAASGVLANDTDADGDRLTVAQVNGNAISVGSPVAGSSGGQFTLDADGSYRFDPNGSFNDLAPGESRTTSVTYQVSDGEGGTASTTLTITVVGAQQAGDISDDFTPFGASYSNDVSNAFSDSDLDGPVAYSATGLPAGLRIDAQSGVISGNPVGIGAFDITVTAVDANGVSVSSSFDLRVLPPAVLPPDADFGPTAGMPAARAPSDVPLIYGGYAGLRDVDMPSVDFTAPELLDSDPLDIGLPHGPGASNVEPVDMRYQATETDGSPLPGTLTINSNTGELTGNLPPGMERAQLTVIAVDDNGNTRTREVWVDENGRPISAEALAQGDRNARDTLYRRVEVVIGTDGTVTVRAVEDGGNEMRTRSIALDGSYLDIQIFDPDASSVDHYAATLTNGDALPPGVRVNSETGRVSGRLADGTQGISINIVAEAGDGTTRVLTVDIERSAPVDNRSAWLSLDAQAREALAAAGDTSAATHGARIAGALGFY